MTNSKFYFYDLSVEEKEGQKFNWEIILDAIKSETDTKTIHYEESSNYKLSIQIGKKETENEEIIYSGFVIVGENEENYQKEKSGEFLELGFDEDESLCHINRGKLAFTLIIKSNNQIILMLEKQYFSINIRGAINYFQKRYSDTIKEIKSKTMIGKDLKNQIINIKDNKVRIARISFKKFATSERVREFGFVEDAIPKLLEQGIHADLILRWDTPLNVETFFQKLFKKESFEDALDVDFGEFLKQFTFDTDNDAVPSLKMLDKLICTYLPLDKADYTDETLFLALKELYNSKKDKLE